MAPGRVTSTRTVLLVLGAVILFTACLGDEPVPDAVLGNQAEPMEVDQEGAFGATKFEGGTDDEDLQHMSSTQLQQLELETMRKVNEVGDQLNLLRNQTAALKEEQHTIDEAVNKLQGAKNWEAEEKRKRDEELSSVKHDVESKQQKIKEMQQGVAELKSRIDELKVHLHNLTMQKESVTKRNDAPSLSDVLDARSQSWSPLTANVYRKTRDKVLPALSGVSDATSAYRRRVSSWPLLDFVASVLLYGFFVGGIFVSFRVYKRVRGHFTIARLLFLGDSFCATFWALMLVCYCFLWTDPLVAIQRRSPALFFVFQLGALVFYVNFVLLRVLMLASSMSLSALGETLAVVVVGHHYYVRVWQPAMMDTEIHGTFFYVLCYAWLFAALALNRVGEFSPLKQVGGSPLPPQMAARMFLNRVFGAKGPDGDLESRPLVDNGGDVDHEN